MIAAKTGSRQFVALLIYSDTNALLSDWILADISSTSPTVALSAMNEMTNQYVTGEAAGIFKEIHIPIVTVNSDLWSINFEANQRHMGSFEAIVLKDADHCCCAAPQPSILPWRKRSEPFLKSRVNNKKMPRNNRQIINFFVDSIS